MGLFARKWSEGYVLRLRVWWTSHRLTLLRIAVAFMIVLALLRLGIEFEQRENKDVQGD